MRLLSWVRYFSNSVAIDRSADCIVRQQRCYRSSSLDLIRAYLYDPCLSFWQGSGQIGRWGGHWRQCNRDHGDFYWQQLERRRGRRFSTISRGLYTSIVVVASAVVPALKVPLVDRLQSRSSGFRLPSERTLAAAGTTMTTTNRPPKTAIAAKAQQKKVNLFPTSWSPNIGRRREHTQNEGKKSKYWSGKCLKTTPWQDQIAAWFGLQFDWNCIRLAKQGIVDIT